MTAPELEPGWAWLDELISPAPMKLDPAHVCVDATDRLLLDFAADFLTHHRTSDVAIIDDEFGALTCGVASLLTPDSTVRVWSRSRGSLNAIRSNVEHVCQVLQNSCATVEIVDECVDDPVTGTVKSSTQLCLLKLPTSVAAMERYSQVIAQAFVTNGVGVSGAEVLNHHDERALAVGANSADLAHSSDDNVDWDRSIPWGSSSQSSPALAVGGRLKFLTPAYTTALTRDFAKVSASRARQKSRLLVAHRPLDRQRDAGQLFCKGQIELRGHTVNTVSFGSVFHGNILDLGSRLLLESFDDWLDSSAAATAWRNYFATGVGCETQQLTIADLGCGNGSLTLLADRFCCARGLRPRFLASDDNYDAVTATVCARAILPPRDQSRICVTWDYSMSGVPDASVDLVLLNPPFHRSGSIDDRQIHGLVEAAARVVKDDGQLWVVFNSMLRYRRVVSAHFAQVRQRGRNPKFTVLQATLPRRTSQVQRSAESSR